ncbi:MAG: HIT domain-containing protein [Candidatus Babeliales bacterium]
MISSHSCIFCNIIAQKIPSVPVLETDDILVIKDINPKATIHYLIIPKKHIPDLRDFKPEDLSLAGTMLMIAQRLSEGLPEPKAFRILMNNGPEAGQCVFHAHMHFLAGKKIPSF